MTPSSTTRPRRFRSVDDLLRMTPEPGDLAFRDSNTNAIYLVAGVAPGDDLEVVSLAQLRERKLVTPDGHQEVLEAIADGRLVSYRIAGDRLSPWPDVIDIPDEVVR